jgi:hypothetical protein
VQPFLFEAKTANDNACSEWRVGWGRDEFYVVSRYDVMPAATLTASRNQDY